METFSCCVDVNPNSNGALSHQAVANAKEVKTNNFLCAPSPQMNTVKGTVHTRNIKKFTNCANACRTKEQEDLLTKTLDRLHLDIMALDGNRKKPASTLDEGGAPSSTDGKRNIASLLAVEKASTYSRKKPVNSPSRYR